MKLVDILARELSGWPEGVLLAVQDEDGEIKFDNSHELPHLSPRGDVWMRQGDKGDSIYGLATASDCATAIVTRAEWQAAIDALGIPDFPSDKPKWNGEGLPPVGTVCELSKPQKFTQGTRLEEFPEGACVLVGGHANFGGSDVAVVIINGTHFTGTTIPELLRPIRTPEQIAAEERGKAIKEMVDIFEAKTGSSPDNEAEVFGWLYDAGYRKFEIIDEPQS